MPKRRPPRIPFTERFWSKVMLPDGNGCMRWTANKFTDGYGAFKMDGKNRGAHRVAYELLVGPIPAGLQLDHLCRVRDCVAPDHLEPVTNAENIRRSLPYRDPGAPHRAKTHCPKNHEYTPENTRIRHYPDKGWTTRECKMCNRDRMRAKARAREGR